MDSLQRIACTAGLTVIANLHYVEYARRYASRVLGLRDGRLVFDGSPAGLTEVALNNIFGEPLAEEVPDLGPMFVGEEIWIPS